jgi:PAS domain S-box-containing protein
MSSQTLPAPATQLFRYLFEQASLGIAVEDFDGTVLLANPALCSMLGYPEDELCGMHCSQFANPEDSEDDWALFQQLRAGAIDRYALEKRYVRNDGSQVWGRLHVSVLKNEDGEPPLVFAFVENITERKLAELQERNRFKELETILDAVPIPVRIAHDAGCQRMTGNRAAYEQARVAPGRNVSSSGPAGERPNYLLMEDGVWVEPESLPMQQAAATGKPVYGRALTVVYGDGTKRETLENAVPLLDETGKPRGAIGTSIDLTERKQAEQAQRESEDRLRLLLDSTAEAIYGIDLEHRCTFCNPACLRTLGYERVDDVLGKNVHDLIHHTRADGTPLPVNECRVHRVTTTGEGIHAEDEVFWRANGTSFPAEYWSYPQRKGQEVIGAVVAFVDITQRRMAEAAVSNVSRKLIEAQERERTRIARELHDDFGQRLSLLTNEVEHISENTPGLPAEAQRQLGELFEHACQIATDLQSLSHELHSAKLEYLGIVAAMRGFCREFGEQQKVEIHFKTDGSPGPPSPEISLCLLRVLQEALHNSAKHSGVRHCNVRLSEESNVLQLTISDSGVGFELDAAKNSSGLGLISMEERLKLVGGTFVIESRPGRGTTIHARVPLRSEETRSIMVAS